jgi:II/X family phage/plasmid replication protein
MIDMICIYAPFRAETFGYVGADKIKIQSGLYDQTARLKVFDFIEICKKENIKFDGYGMSFDFENGIEKVSVTGLNAPFEQLESSFSGIALKINHAPTIGTPHIVLKASPAKLLLGHNIFGYDDIQSGVVIMLYTLIKTYPFLAQYIDFDQSEIRQLDINYSFRMKSKEDCLYLLDYLQNVSYKQTKANEVESNRFKETTYFGNKNSKHKFIRMYYKHDEVIKTLQSKTKQHLNNVTKHQISVLSNPELIEFSKNLLRVEAALRKVWIEKKFGSTLLSVVLARNDIVICDLWMDAMSDLFKAVGDVTLKNQSDESVREKINKMFVTYNKKTGKESLANANNIYAFYRLIISDGYKSVKDTTSKATFYRRISDLESIGISRAQLQNYNSLDSSTRNIIPFVKIIDLTNVVHAPQPMPNYLQNLDSDILDIVSTIIKKAV